MWIEQGLAYTNVSLTYRGQQQTFSRVLIDTGSGGTLFSVDKVIPLGVQYEMHDRIHRVRGVGGTEFVFCKRIDRVVVETLELRDFEIELGVMDYGLELDGIVGMDFLLAVGAVIDLSQQCLSCGVNTEHSSTQDPLC